MFDLQGDTFNTSNNAFYKCVRTQGYLPPPKKKGHHECSEATPVRQDSNSSELATVLFVG